MKNVQHLEITEVVLVHCNIVNNGYQQDSGVLHMFVLNKPFGSFSNKSYLFKSIQLGIWWNYSMLHRSKESTIRNRRQNKFNNGDQMKNIKMRYSTEPRDKSG